MKSVIATEKVPIKLWLDNVEEGALEQAKNAANLPFIFKWVSLMPDTHQGYGVPIGSVVPTTDAIIPNAVGVDIGCGVKVIQTSLRADQLSKDDIKKVMSFIREGVPVGFNKHSKPIYEDRMPTTSSTRLPTNEINNALLQLGTLGGGNHFIELDESKEGSLCVMIHCGSRHLGYAIANYHNTRAKEHNSKWYSSVPKEWDLSFLPVGSSAWLWFDYITDHNFALEYAKENRTIIGDVVIDALGRSGFECETVNTLDVHHNYVSKENHYNKNVWVHRKGAIRARENELGIVPGSQGTPSYIVRGKGNQESFNSCSHGAGRVMGRNEAKKTLDLNSVVANLDGKGIVHSIRTKKDLDEAPEAYKPINEVMKNQETLVDVVNELRPLAVIKG